MQRHDDETLSSLGLRPTTADDTPFLKRLFASTRSDELALLAYDISTVRQGLASRWYASLRVQLILMVVVLLTVAVLA